MRAPQCVIALSTALALWLAATAPAQASGAERLNLPGAIPAFRTALRLGYEDADFFLYQSPGYNQPVVVMRFVPQNWRQRQSEAQRLFLEVLPDLDDVKPFIAVITAQPRLGSLREDPTIGGDWVLVRRPNNTWRMLDQDISRYVRSELNSLPEDAEPHRRAYWEWQLGTLSSDPNQAINALRNAHGRLQEVDDDPWELRHRTNRSLVTLHHQLGQRENMQPYLVELARLTGLSEGHVGEQEPLLGNPIRLPRQARDLNDAELSDARVMLRYTLSPYGLPENIHVIEEMPENAGLGQAASDALQRWVFLPRLENGEPVETPNVTRVVRFD